MDDHIEEVQEWPHFGAYLKAYRLKNNITVREICDETRLSRFMVASIEEGDRGALPEDVLLKSFLRSIAGACGADGNTVVSLYLEAYPPTSESPPFCSPVNRTRNLGLLVGLFCLVSLVAVFFFEAL